LSPVSVYPQSSSNNNPPQSPSVWEELQRLAGELGLLAIVHEGFSICVNSSVNMLSGKILFETQYKSRLDRNSNRLLGVWLSQRHVDLTAKHFQGSRQRRMAGSVVIKKFKSNEACL
jgi:hypothetical protein